MADSNSLEEGSESDDSGWSVASSPKKNQPKKCKR